MTFELMLILGLGLAMDAFAVTVSDAVAWPHETRARLFLLPVFFGLFQGLLPVLGYVLGNVAGDFVEDFSGIIALVVLAVIGGNMVREGIRDLRRPGEHAMVKEGRLSIGVILVQAVATAIDAFAVGVSLRAMHADLLIAVSVIGVVTFLACCVAVPLGRKVGEALGVRAQILGGCILIAIGIRAFLS